MNLGTRYIVFTSPILLIKGPRRIKQSIFCCWSKASCFANNTFLSRYPEMNDFFMYIDYNGREPF